MDMKIILHGATNGSNFGDYLFADIFWHTLLSCNKDGKTLFFEFPRYGFGRFFRKELGYTHKQTIGDVFNGDMLVYFSGGYFGQRTSSLKESIKRLIRYMPIGIVFALRRKPILMLGVGGGPITNKLLRSAICWLMNRAAIVTVRDEETANYFKSYGVKKEIKVTSDTAQVITPDSLPPLDDAVKDSIKKSFAGKKIIFLHALGGDRGDKLFCEKIIPPLNSFLARHPEYGVILGYDEIYAKSIEHLNIKTKLACKTVYCYDYRHPWQLCSLLKEVDMIITAKLHVGIVSAALSKSVVSFPVHSEKTKRYYRQIGEPERCMPLRDTTPVIIENMLECLHDKKISLPDPIIRAAKENLYILEDTIHAFRDKASFEVEF